MPAEQKSTVPTAAHTAAPMERWLRGILVTLVDDNAIEVDSNIAFAREQDALNADLKQQRDDLLAACEAHEAYNIGAPTPWGHDCRWCGLCIHRVNDMRRAAIRRATTAERVIRVPHYRVVRDNEPPEAQS